MIEPPDPHDPYRSCVLTVTETRSDRLVLAAVAQAATFLREDEGDLYAAEVGSARPAEWSRFRRNLGEPAPVIRWTATVTVRLRPEIVEQRRGASNAPSPSRKRAKSRHLSAVKPPSPGVTESDSE